MAFEDAYMGNQIRHEIVKRGFDSSRIEVRVCHGVVYLTGEARTIRGQECDLRKEMEILHHVLRSKPGIRDIVDQVFLKHSLKL